MRCDYRIDAYVPAAVQNMALFAAFADLASGGAGAGDGDEDEGDGDGVRVTVTGWC